MRFELGYYALNPDIKVIAPWREWDLASRTKLIAYAEANQIPVPKDKRGEAPFSVDANLLHISAEGKVLKIRGLALRNISSRAQFHQKHAPDVRQQKLKSTFHNGDPVAINGKALSPADLLTELNRLGGMNGIGRLDLVENRFVGMKSRGIYETPGGTICSKQDAPSNPLPLIEALRT